MQKNNFKWWLIAGIVTWAALGTVFSKSPVFLYYILAHCLTSGLLWFGVNRLERRAIQRGG